jgi:deoxyribodipyrimidine photo-lyase
LRFKSNGNAYKHIDDRYDKLKWKKVSITEWNHFIESTTGYLLIDAIMNELIQTGYIGNRARLLLATFWTKYLLIDPFDLEYGAQAGFSRYLIDCSTSQNKMNHQWVIGDLDLSGHRFCMKGTSPLSGRVIRIDNGIISKYDPQFEYIKKWIPQYKNKSVKEMKLIVKNINPIFNWKDRYSMYTDMFSKLK